VLKSTVTASNVMLDAEGLVQKYDALVALQRTIVRKIVSVVIDKLICLTALTLMISVAKQIHSCLIESL
jgi:hypothetical protein